MTDDPETPQSKLGRGGAFIGGITGLLLWFGQPEGLINVSGVTEWLAMGVFVGAFILVGTLIEWFAKTQ